MRRLRRRDETRGRPPPFGPRAPRARPVIGVAFIGIGINPACSRARAVTRRCFANDGRCVQDAFATLSDPSRRAAHNGQLRRLRTMRRARVTRHARAISETAVAHAKYQTSQKPVSIPVAALLFFVLL